MLLVRLTHNCFLTYHVLEPTRGGNVMNVMLSSRNQFVDNNDNKYMKLGVPVTITTSILI